MAGRYGGRLESIKPARLSELANDLGAWLAAEDEPELTRCLDLRVAQLEGEWGLPLPSLARYEEEGVMLKERFDRWAAEILQRGVEQGLEKGRAQGIEQGLAQAAAHEKALLRRQALRRFGATAAERLTAALDDVHDNDRLFLAGDWIADSVNAEDFLARVARGAGG